MTRKLDVDALLQSMQQDLKQALQQCQVSDPVMIGIRTGGVWVAKRLHQALALSTPLSSLNISFYRDDFTRIGVHPQVQPSELPYDLTDRCIILVDDVLFTGRTIRAAMNEIFDYGRPARILLAVLVDRGGRELPIQADIIGTTITPAAGEQIKLTGPDPLKLDIITP